MSNQPYIAKQRRSQQTLERLLNATLALLEQRSFEDITVQDITRRAASSVGAFYKRFPSKQAMLPAILEHLQKQQIVALEEYLDEANWRGMGLVERIRHMAELSVSSYREHARLMKALLSRQFSEHNEMTSTQIQDSSCSIVLMRDWLMHCRDEVEHPQPEKAITIGLASLFITMQTSLLFDAKPRRH